MSARAAAPPTLGGVVRELSWPTCAPITWVGSPTPAGVCLRAGFPLWGGTAYPSPSSQCRSMCPAGGPARPRTAMHAAM
eukprot:9315713-Pyramimonas_sp.AAC.1